MAIQTTTLNSSAGVSWDALGNITCNSVTQNNPLSFPFTSIVTQIFTANGTYTPTTGMRYVWIRAVGAGGGAGGANAAIGANISAAGGGGASGEYAELIASAATIGASQAITIGAGGIGGDGAPTDGSAGGNTSVGSLLVANGGLGGIAMKAPTLAPRSAAGGVGGTGGTGDFLIDGATGGASMALGVPLAMGGIGAPSQLSPHAVATMNLTGASTIAGNPGKSYGGGGAGGACISSAGGAQTAVGGDGHDGVVFILEFIG